MLSRMQKVLGILELFYEILTHAQLKCIFHVRQPKEIIHRIYRSIQNNTWDFNLFLHVQYL